MYDMQGSEHESLPAGPVLGHVVSLSANQDSKLGGKNAAP